MFKRAKKWQEIFPYRILLVNPVLKNLGVQTSNPIEVLHQKHAIIILVQNVNALKLAMMYTTILKKNFIEL